MFILQVLSCILLLILSANGINRSSYKIALTQEGYIQFLAYELETPAIKEFTFCMWIRVLSLKNDQTIFSYVGKNKLRIVSMWLESGGYNLKVTINNGEYSTVPVDWKVGVWKHVCMSYQSSDGAWAIYINGHLEQCEAARSIVGFVLPADGSIIVGYGRSKNNSPSGLEGDIYGFSMILSSTIKGNLTTKATNQVIFTKNKILYKKPIDYVVLGDLLYAKTSDVRKESLASTMNNINEARKSHVKISTPHSFVDHDIGDVIKNISESNTRYDSDMDIFDLDGNIENSTINSKINFWNLINKAGNEGKFKKEQTLKKYFTTENPIFPSIFERPPPIDQHKIIEQNVDNNKQNIDMEQQNSRKLSEGNKKLDPNFSKHTTYSLSEIEKPPPINNIINNNVFGQWSSTNFANRVLTYIRNGNKDKKIIPATIPLRKTSDSYPYPSEFKVVTIKPFNIVRPNDKNYKIKIISKRQAKSPEINVRIQSANIRDYILQEHLENEAKNVIVTSRGESNFATHNNSFSLSNINSQGNHEINKSRYNRSNMNGSQNLTLKSIFNEEDSIPFPISTFENGVKMFHRDNPFNDSNNKIYFKGNIWHNVKTYNDDYTPRSILSYMTVNDKNKHDDEDTPIGRDFKETYKRVISNKNDEQEVIRGRKLASDVANQANPSVKIFKSFLSGQKFKIPILSDVSTHRNYDKKVNFDKNVKLGNALDERIIGLTATERKRSFLGGNDEIPDINQYRSDIDNERTSIVPPSLRPRVCNSAGVNGRTLYVQSDGTINWSHILSPFKLYNIGIEFITQSYKNCLLDGTSIRNNPLIFIDWSITPVRLFGGARPKINHDICGLF